MRIKSLLTVFITGLTLSVTGCGPEAEPLPESQPAPLEEQVSQRSEALAAGFCASAWTCDSLKYYSSQALCASACAGAPCYREPYCRPGCICP
jgi:hypothetical protein